MIFRMRIIDILAVSPVEEKRMEKVFSFGLFLKGDNAAPPLCRWCGFRGVDPAIHCCTSSTGHSVPYRANFPPLETEFEQQ